MNEHRPFTGAAIGIPPVTVTLGEIGVEGTKQGIESSDVVWDLEIVATLEGIRDQCKRLGILSHQERKRRKKELVLEASRVVGLQTPVAITAVAIPSLLERISNAVKDNIAARLIINEIKSLLVS